MKATLLATLALLVLSPALHAEEDIRVPSGVDLSGLKQLDAEIAQPGTANRSHKLQITPVMLAIDPHKVQMLFPDHVGKGMGTPDQLSERFKKTISATNRFTIPDDRQTGIMEGIIVEAQITGASQSIEDYRAFLKSVTTVRMAVAVKEIEGQVLRSKNLTAVYGSDPGEGTIIKSLNSLKLVRPNVCQEPKACENLENDYGLALQEIFNNLGAYIERTYRPLSKVLDVDGDLITMHGSSESGFNADEELVVFRTRPLSNEDGKPLPPALKAIAVVHCSVGDNLSCRVIRKGRFGDVHKGDYAVTSDRMLKLHEEN